ncbi:hypothetical protein ACFQE0_15360 [Methylobacterium komagatae]|uniref:Uncharacterized protein n=1 Tax=Methylobacterium komagatae TaxID=374425 RepID=A0ABW2BL82_9HYPH
MALADRHARMFRRDLAVEATPALGTTRIWLVGLTSLALLVAGAAALRPPAAIPDADLARVIRFMAAMKGVFALMAFAASYWRIARPAASWRVAVYVTAPPAMAGGAVALWCFENAGLAAAGLHLGLFAMLAAALTDRDFLPDFVRR